MASQLSRLHKKAQAVIQQENPLSKSYGNAAPPAPPASGRANGQSANFASPHAPRRASDPVRVADRNFGIGQKSSQGMNNVPSGQNMANSGMPNV